MPPLEQKGFAMGLFISGHPALNVEKPGIAVYRMDSRTIL